MDIYILRIKDITYEELNSLCRLIDLCKGNRIGKFINKRDKIRTLIGDILIRNIIAKKLNIKNKQIMFGENIYGKPYLKGYYNINFNLSHSEDIIVCSVDDKNIGCDIEKIKPIEYREIAKRFFSEREFNYVTKCDSCDQLGRFYEIWTLKESYIKCCGLGLFIPLKSFSVDSDKFENIRILLNNKYTAHTLMTFYIQPAYKMSICSEGNEISRNIKFVDQKNLISEFYDICF